MRRRAWGNLTARLASPEHDVSLRLTRRSARRERADRTAALSDELERLLADDPALAHRAMRPEMDRVGGGDPSLGGGRPSSCVHEYGLG